ncbi:MAG TPA: hypothetical protein VK894_14960 [Jiangellales bacterium]|nr:hypothetical protein [Jiangellales bacterium]
MSWPGPEGDVAITTRASWLVLRQDEKPVAEVFSVAYVADEPSTGTGRPVTLVFNGGPGASSVLRTDRTYELLSEEVNKQWRIDLERHALERGCVT